MSVETIILAAAITTMIVLVRRHWPLVAGVWQEACWWERTILVVALLPIPGPVDEIAGLLVVRRVVRRRGAV